MLYAQLMRIKPAGLTERQWTIKAGVSPSFFVNLRGSATKPPSEPTIGNLRAVVEATGVSLLDFFALEASVRMVPTKQALEKALSEVLDRLPNEPEDRLAYLATNLSGALALPESYASSEETPDRIETVDSEEGYAPRRATRRS